ncbi:MAG: hypothetical protein AzoDbin1_03595 [Azoarcus sp.]|nr:hypothetical protein [Azoarcus sp.]
MQITIENVLRVSVRHTYLRQGRFYYQRSIPLDLADRYPARLIKRNLGTSDPLVAAQKVAHLDSQYEAEWGSLRSDPRSSPATSPDDLLKLSGLNPRDSITLSHFSSRLNREHQAVPDALRTLGEDAPCSAEAPAVDPVTDVTNSDTDVLSDALRIYLASHHKGDTESIRKASTIAVKGFIALRGDKPMKSLCRADGRAYIKAELDRGVTTATARRRLTALNAIFNAYAQERELDRKSPFSGHKIAGEGEDGKERQPFTPEELKTLQTKCREADDDLRWIVALLSDTGARLAEMTGLALDDLNTDAEIPHVVIKPHPWRSLKNKESDRTIPLVGASLWAARRVQESATVDQRYAFPRYIKGGKCKATSASAALNKWMRLAGMEHTCHELRHTMRDRLRNVQCPRDIAHAIGGWTFDDKASEGDGYGKGYSLTIKQEWLQKVTENSET